MTRWDPRIKPPFRMTEAQYVAPGDNDFRQELLDGEPRASPASTPHVELRLTLRQALRQPARDAGLEVLLTPNLRLAPLRYLSPDLAAGTFGRTTTFNPPSDAAMVVEIASPTISPRDFGRKRRFYAESGIDWYLLVEPDFTDYRSVALSLSRRDSETYVRVAEAGAGETLHSDQPFRIALSTDDLVDFG